MADSKISWTDKTWNPVTGCTKVSPGCDLCYAEKFSARLAGKGDAAYDKAVYLKARDGRTGWTGKVTPNDEVLYHPWEWKKPKMIFVCSMSDLFHPSVPLNWILRVFVVMHGAPQHTFQVLTKRPGRMAYFANHHLPKMSCGTIAWPDNVWAGTSLEMMSNGNKKLSARLDLLASVPARVRFVSAEPLLGPLDLRPWLSGNCEAWGGTSDGRVLDWVIVGGESGPGARPTHPDWARDIRDQCQAAGVPFHFKQWGAYRDAISRGMVKDIRNCLYVSPEGETWPAGRRPPDRFNGYGMMERVGAKAAGAVLDGREWQEFPDA